MVLAAQRAQNAAAGYAADDQCKRHAPSFNEVREIKKGTPRAGGADEGQDRGVPIEQAHEEVSQ
eukprot:7840411-Pyramimonas_sp.AAC.1